jgi:4-amino-4-deoxy-L-arabinose transferase-like glycosyltransferase
MGGGYLHDDFVLLSSAAFEPLAAGLTSANGGTFYAPLTWLTFRSEWYFWEQNPFWSASVNLLLHLINVVLVYSLGRLFTRSHPAALIAAAGFGILVPSSVWAVMWIATRAHLLTTTFYLATILAIVIWARTGKVIAFFAAIMLSGGAIFSKEIGITVIAAAAVMLIYERSSGFFRLRSGILLVGAIGVVAAVYVWLRAGSGALNISFGGNEWYSYTTSFAIFLDNVRSYAWRDFGWVALIWAAATLGQKIARRRIDFRSFTATELLFPILLSVLTLAPVILVAGRSGIYTYLSSAFAGLLLAQLLEKYFRPETKPRFSLAVGLPIAVVLIVFSIFTVGQSRKWRTMAETSTSVLAQIKTQLPEIEPETEIVIEYADSDTRFYFPDCFASWGLEPAMRLLYMDPTSKGRVERSDLQTTLKRPSEIRFVYSTSESGPTVTLK